MIVPNKFNGYNRDGTRNLFFGGGGGGPTQTTSTVQNTNVPEYAQPYVESMLGATQNQLFNTSQVQTGTDDQGKAIMGTQIDSFKPYQAYGGTYDDKGKQLTYDPTKGIAGFTPDQLKTQQGIMGLQVPAEYRTAGMGMQSVYDDMKTNAYTAPTNLGYTADKATAATAGTSQNAVGSGYTASNAGSQGYTSKDATSQGYTSSDAAAIKAEAARLGVAPEAIAAQFKGPQDIASGIVSSGSPLTAFQMQAAQSQYAPGLSQYSMDAAPVVATKSFTDKGTAASYMSPYMQQVVDAQKQEAQRESDIAGQAQQAQAARSGAFGGSRDSIMRAEAARNLATQKGNIQAQGLQSAFQQAQQQFNAEQGIGLQGQVANQQAGLTVGQQNLGAKLGIQQLGTQTGTQIALANLSNTQQAEVQNQAAKLQAQGMTSSQALQAALANQSSGLQAAQANQGMAFNTAAQNAQLAQQTALANQSMKGQYGLTQGQFDQAANAQTSSQAQNAALANAAAKSAASQFGASAANQAQLANAAAFNQAAQFGAGAANTAALQNAAAASQASQFGAAAGNQASLANQAASNQMAQYNAGLGQQTALANQAAANQAAQFGAGQNLTSAQTAAQYGLAGNALQLQAAQQYAGLGQQNLAAQQGILGMQSTVGAQQQALDQAAKNQAIQDYANAQQYPLMQLGTMSNMLRGLPMQASTTNQYAASPNPLSTAVGTIGAGASIYNATKPGPGGAAGGLPSEFKYAKGGIASVPRYDMGGEVESQLENMDEKGLAAQAKESSSPSIRRMAQRLLRERQMGKPSQGTGPMGVQYQAAQPQMPAMYSGGIIAFAKGDTVYGGPSTENDPQNEEDARIGMQERLAQAAPTTGGIMGATTPPTTPIPSGPTAGRAVQQTATIPDFMKAEYADTEKRMNAPLSTFMAERRAAMQEAGVADASEGQQKQRAEMMAEKANMADEKQRQKYMRLAEFFASWGSTPGPTLVAGLNAMQKTVPNIISDEREQKKARREIDKSIADLDNATRLEKRGEVDAAMALKLKAAEDMKALNIKFIDYQSRRDSDASSSAASKYSADMQFRSEQLRSQTSALERAARRETDDDQKRINTYNAASGRELNLISKISDQMKLLAPDYETIKTMEMNAKQNDGKMNPTFVPAYEAAKKKIADQEAIWTKQKEQAARDSELAYNRIRINPEAAKDYTKPGGSPAPAAAPSGPISGDFKAPPAAAINALRTNPDKIDLKTLKSDFDYHFGPGAADEYLGK
tara:strand:- start:275 stop:4054 length:3780 start_codon:yes stop_codon:yes gene_type:complete